MSEKNNKKSAFQEEDLFSIKDLLYMCLAKWHWFVLSLVVCMGLAVAYVLVSHPVYTRTASVLIKEDTKGNSMSAVSEEISNLGIFSNRSNVHNEIGVMQSPDIMQEVVLRLHLEIDYYTEGRFHNNILYGDSLPVRVDLVDFPMDMSASFRVLLNDRGEFALSDIVVGLEEYKDTIFGILNDTVASPMGAVVVHPSTHYAECSAKEILVFRNTVHNAVSSCAGRLAVSLADKNASIISLTFNDVSIQRADDVLNTVIAVYNEGWVKDKNQMVVSTNLFINDRLGVIESELGNVDDDISSFKSKNLLPDVQAAASLYMSQASEAKSALKTLNDQLYMVRYIKNYLANEANKHQLLPANSGIDNTVIGEQISAYNKQLMERNNIVSKSSERNPLVKDMDETLASLGSALLSSIDNELVALKAQIESQQNYGGVATSHIASNPKQAKYLLSVERQQKIKETLYLYLLQKREENELSQAFTAYNTRVICKPNGSTAPTAPVKRNILLIGFALGLLIPVGIIYLKESMNTVLRGRKDLEGLSVPIVGEIPLCESGKKGGLFSKSSAKSESVGVVVKDGSRNIINEAFRVLRSNIEFMQGADTNENVYAVTSFNPGSGKSFLAVNIAISFAVKGKKVLLIDGDLRHGSTSVYMNSPSNGLSLYLNGKENDWRSLVSCSDDCDLLDVLPIGAIPPNPTELLENGRLESLISEARSEYDFIFIDCPPIDILADAQIIEKITDRTLFVIRAGLLERSMLPDVENIYQQKRFKNFSLVLNGTECNNGRYGSRYGYKYGYYSSSSYYNSSEV